MAIAGVIKGLLEAHEEADEAGLEFVRHLIAMALLELGRDCEKAPAAKEAERRPARSALIRSPPRIPKRQARRCSLH
jgi:hypothetical protein